MTPDLTLVGLVAEASLLVKLVMLLLLLASFFSWYVIFRKRISLGRARSAASAFEDLFWSGKDLVSIYNRINAPRYEPSAMERIFHSGFREFARLRTQPGMDARSLLEGTQRAMRVAVTRELDDLERPPGEFRLKPGTGLANVHQATLAMVAPGIAEALIATAMGLFAAIPAVVAYNRYTTEVDRLTSRYETFVDEFSSILQRQSNS